MTAVKRLLSVLKGDPKSSGKVVKIDSSGASVATRGGVVVLPPGKYSGLSVGDEVKLSNGSLVGKVRVADSLPVYEV